MKTKTLLTKMGAALINVALAFALVLTGCSKKDGTSASGQAKLDYPTKNFEFLAPSGAGGGWDTTIRMIAKVLSDEKLITKAMPVTNKVGGGGAVNLAYMQQKKGNPYTIAVYSPPLLFINLTGQTKLSYKDVTPIAQIIEDYAAFAVPAASPYKTINDVFDALKKDPKSIKFGGNSSAGSMDHVQFLVAAKAAGVQNLKDIPYVALQDGPMASLMGGHIDLVSTGMAETAGPLESGDIRVLAVTSPQRVKAGVLAQVPTLIEQGINVTFENWRGLFGTPGMGTAERDYMALVLKNMCKSQQWKDVCTKYAWEPIYKGPADFQAYLDKQNERFKGILADIGMLKVQ